MITRNRSRRQDTAENTPQNEEIEIIDEKPKASKPRNVKKKTKPTHDNSIIDEEPSNTPISRAKAPKKKSIIGKEDTQTKYSPLVKDDPTKKKKKSTTTESHKHHTKSTSSSSSVIDITSDNEACADSTEPTVAAKEPKSKQQQPSTIELNDSVDDSSLLHPTKTKASIQQPNIITIKTEQDTPTTTPVQAKQSPPSKVATIKQEPAGLRRVPSVVPAYSYNDSVDDISLDKMLGTPLTCPKTNQRINTASVMKTKTQSKGESAIKPLRIKIEKDDTVTTTKSTTAAAKKNTKKKKSKEKKVSPSASNGNEPPSLSTSTAPATAPAPAPTFFKKPSSKYVPPHNRGPLASGKHGVFSLKPMHTKKFKKQRRPQEQNESSWFVKKQQQNWQNIFTQQNSENIKASTIINTSPLATAAASFQKQQPRQRSFTGQSSNFSAAQPLPSSSQNRKSTTTTMNTPSSSSYVPPHRFTGQSSKSCAAPPQPILVSPKFQSTGPLAAGMTASPSTPLMDMSLLGNGPLMNGVSHLTGMKKYSMKKGWML